jgi:hypothetical protein
MLHITFTSLQQPWVPYKRAVGRRTLYSPYLLQKLAKHCTTSLYFIEVLKY